MKEFGILLFGHTRSECIDVVLKSLQKQDALQYVDVWLDGHQGVTQVREKCIEVQNVVESYPVSSVRSHNGALGFRKIIIQALKLSVQKYKYLMVLEDDCFPTRDAVSIFRNEIAGIENNENIFSVYGHPFLVKNEGEICTRFQGWGWGTTSNKLEPILDQLIKCYSLPEEEYLKFTRTVLTKEMIKVLDITPNRQPTNTLTKFFAWDETIALLTALQGKFHKKTSKRTIYNFGGSEDSERFKSVQMFKQPPFNMVAFDEIWDYF